MKTISFYASVVLMIFLVSAGSCDSENKPTDTLVELNTVPSCTETFTNDTNFINNNQFGISVQNLYHHTIWRFKSKRAWRPITGFRATVGGRLEKYKLSILHSDQKEYDWNLHVTPSPAFVPSMGAGEILGEVTPALTLRKNDFFSPFPEFNPIIPSWLLPSVLQLESPLVGKDICLYGPWVKDFGNDDIPEIHPSEAIWWQNTPGSNSDVQLVLVQDGAIGRFTECSDFDLDEDNNGVKDDAPGWTPWVTYPQTEEIKIPFQYDPQTKRYSIISIEEVKSHNIVTVLNPDLDDSDNGTDHKLKTSTFGPVDLNQPVLVEARENGADPNLGVQFTDVCKSSTGIINGNVRVLVAIGAENTRDPGFMILRFRISSAVNNEVGNTQ